MKKIISRKGEELGRPVEVGARWIALRRGLKQFAMIGAMEETPENALFDSIIMIGIQLLKKFNIRLQFLSPRLDGCSRPDLVVAQF